MAIPFSLPASSTSSGRNHRESLSTTTGIRGPGEVSFSELSLSSQLLYLAMVEAMRVVQDIAQEVSDQDYDTEYSNFVQSDDQDEPDCRILPKINKDEDDSKFEECPKYEDFIVTSSIGDHEPVESEEDNIKYVEKTERRHGGQVPDLVADIIGDHAESNISNTIIPDLIVSVTNDDTTNHAHDKADHIIPNGPLMDRKNLPDLVLTDAKSSRSKRKPRIVPGTRSFKTDDLNKPQNEFVASNKPCQIIPGNGHQDNSDKSEDQKNQWRLIGRDLAKIADNHSVRHGEGHSRMTRRRISSSAAMSGMETQLERVVGMNCLRRDNHPLHNRFCHYCHPQLRENTSISSQSLSVTITNIAINGLLYIVNNLL